eukprot:5051713-Pyramimonas_sp.AAC.1
MWQGKGRGRTDCLLLASTCCPCPSGGRSGPRAWRTFRALRAPVARVIATFTLLALSMKPESCHLLDLVVRKMTRSASPPWLESMGEM